jgi:hypothetical protein
MLADDETQQTLQEGIDSTLVDHERDKLLHRLISGNHGLFDLRALHDALDGTWLREMLLGPLSSLSEEEILKQFPVAERLQYLIRKGAHINHWSEYDHDTPLNVAAMNGKSKSVALLISCKADVTHQNTEGFLTLHVALRACHCPGPDRIAIAKQLIDAGASVHERDEFGGSALFHASDFEAHRFLLEQKADVNARNSLGNTILHEGRFCSSVDFVRACVENGINIDAKNHANMTALEVARTEEHICCVASFEEFYEDRYRMVIVRDIDSAICHIERMPLALIRIIGGYVDPREYPMWDAPLA